MTAHEFLDAALGIYAALATVVSVALGHDIATEHHPHDREGN